MVIWRQTFRTPAFLLFLPLLLLLLACGEPPTPTPLPTPAPTPAPTPRPAPTPTSAAPYWEDKVASDRSVTDNLKEEVDRAAKNRAAKEEEYDAALAKAQEKYAGSTQRDEDSFTRDVDSTAWANAILSVESQKIIENTIKLEEDNEEYENWIEGLEAENWEKSREIDHREVDAKLATKDLEKRLEALVDELTTEIVAELNLEIENRYAALEKRRTNLQGQVENLDAEAAKLETSVSQLREQVRTAEAGRHTAEFELKELAASTELCRTKLSSLIEAMESIRDRARGLALSTGVTGFSQEMKTLLDAFPEECLATTEG